jgi:hypothetical protein
MPHRSLLDLLVIFDSFALEALALLMGGQSVVLLELAEARLRAPERMRGHCCALAAREDAFLLVRHAHQPGVVLPRLGP